MKKSPLKQSRYDYDLDPVRTHFTEEDIKLRKEESEGYDVKDLEVSDRSEKQVYEYYTDGDGNIVNLGHLDEDEQILFLVQNQDANYTKSTDLELRKKGVIEPNSDFQELLDEENRNFRTRDINYFMDLKYGPRKRHGRSGVSIRDTEQALGDNVTREHFESDEEWYRYQVWNGDIIHEISLDESIQNQVNLQDLDVDANATNLYYNQDNSTDFVKEFYSARDLPEGINLVDFEGFLNRMDYADSFRELEEQGAFDYSIGYFGSGDQEDLNVARQRMLDQYLREYIHDTNIKLTEGEFYKDYIADKDKYKDYKDFTSAYEAWRVEKGMEEIDMYSYIDGQAFQDYRNTHFNNLIKREKENKKKQQDYLAERIDQSGAESFGWGVGEFIGGLFEGVFDDGAGGFMTWLTDLIGLDGMANEVRLLKKENSYQDPQEQMRYWFADGKSLTIDGTKYVLDKYDNRLYIAEQDGRSIGLAVGDTMSADEQQAIIDQIRLKGVDDMDWSHRGGTQLMGEVLGNVGFQLIGTKGLGSARLALSTRYLARANGFKNVAQYRKYMKMLSQNPKRIKSFNAPGNIQGKASYLKGTGNIKLSFDARILDATMFQGMYGGQVGFENTITAALEAGIPYNEARSLAQMAQSQMAILYMLTGPINPRLPGLNVLDDLMGKNEVLKGVIKVYQQTGSKKLAGNHFWKEMGKLMPSRGSVFTIGQEGFREFVQENVQQMGEAFWVNNNVNRKAGKDFLDAEYSLKDFIQTSILSFAAGGIVGGASTVNLSRGNIDAGKARLQDMWLLSRDADGTRRKLDWFVERGRLDPKTAAEIMKDVKAIGNARFPSWMINTPEDLMELARAQEELRDLNRKKKKLDVPDKKLDAKIKTVTTRLDEIIENAADQALDQDIKDVTKFAGTDNVVTLKEQADFDKYGLSDADFASDGWFLEKDGKIYINRPRALKTKAITVANHEMLHKILNSEIKNNPQFKQVVEEFKEILKEKGVLNVLERRAKKYRDAKKLFDDTGGKLGLDTDIDGYDSDEWLTMFSDALQKNEISYESLGENEWLRMGRRLLDTVRTRLGLKKGIEFENGQQAYDFIVDYAQNIRESKLSNKAQRMLNSFEKDKDGRKKGSIDMTDEINQEKLDALVDPTIPFQNSNAHKVAKNLIDGGHFDKLIGAKLAPGKTIHGRARSEVMEEVREELKKHLERFDPTKNESLFGYINSYIGYKVGTVTNKAKKAVTTTGMEVRVDGENVTRDFADTAPNPEELMMIKEAAEAEQKQESRLRMGKKIPTEIEAEILKILVPIVRDIETGLLDIKSINAKNSPLIKELKKKLGNSLVYDQMINWLGTRKELRENLLNLKEDILENGTTTWLMGRDMGNKVDGGIPQVIEKDIKLKDGSEVRVPYPEWVGQEIAREKTDTDNAGRTAGHDLVFKTEDAVSLDDDIYLSQFYKDGKLIRGRKEGLAKHMAQEVGIEFILNELMNNPNGVIAKTFEENQTAKGVLNILDKINQFIEQSKRSGIKRSLSYDPEVAMMYIEQAIFLELQGRTTDLDDLLKYRIPPEYQWVVPIYENHRLDFQSMVLTNQLKDFVKQEGNEKVKPYVKKFLKMKKEEKIEAIIDFSEELAGFLPTELYDLMGETQIKHMLGIHRRVIKPGSKAANNVINKVRKTKGSVAFTSVSSVQAGNGIVLRISNKILGREFKTRENALAALEEEFGEEIADLNANNLVALVYILEQAQEIVAKNPNLIPGYLMWLQSSSQLGQGLRALTKIQDIEIHAISQAPFVGLDGKFYWTIGKDQKEDWENGKINKNYKHPLYETTEKWVNNKIAAYKKALKNPNISEKDRKKAQGYLDKSDWQRYRERLRPKGEHKNPVSNIFGKVAVHQLKLINTILNKELKGDNIKKIIQANSARGRKGLEAILSDFTQSIGTEMLSQIQDDVHGKNSELGDLRIWAIPEKNIKDFFPMQDEVQALGRAERALEIEIERYAEILSQQQVIDNKQKRSLSLEPKGMSAFDFDDTLAFTDSKVIVNLPPQIVNGKQYGYETWDNGRVKMTSVATERITPAEFAKKHEGYESIGATFDFTEFNEVKKGKPGPLAPKLKKAIDKFGNENIYIVTARPPDSAPAIHAFLKGLELEIPLENIVGLENGTAKAKADWIVKKIAQGYNDIYFVDDVWKNVKAVQKVLDTFDVKGKVQQAVIKRKMSLSEDLNDMVERNTGVKSEATFSKIVARKKGAGKGKYTVFVPYSAEDFRGLTSYTLAGKGKQGEMDQEFFEKNLVDPYARGIAALEMERQSIKNDYRALLKAYPDLKKKLNKEAISGFTYDQVIRIYLYVKSGHEVPGISKRDLKTVINFVNKNPDIKQFANTLQVISKKAEWIVPDEFWDVGSILKDFNNLEETISRKEHLAEFIENVDLIFNEKNLNKLEAIYGTQYRKALENIIKRMKSGSNRPGNVGGIEGRWLTWVNNSVGTIMFFNRRSAFLQMISFTNFVNWSDNNPLMAATAFANQSLYWKTWVKIFNSDKLKQRRGGLKSDVQEQEIANAAKNSKDSPSAIVSYLLKIGFTPTQIADSMAIATGGATFLINRTKTYLKQGLTQEEADKKAWEDFVKISDETQQSGDPMLISSEQASHLGRLILAFQNTPMQYTRLMKKAGQDLIAGRGDWKTNMSKIMYYGFVQNLLFNALQQALFALLPEFDPDDDEEKYDKLIQTKKERILNGMIDTILRGSGLKGAILSTLKNTINRYYREEKKGWTADHTYTLIELANISPPIGSKLRKVYSAIQTMRFQGDVVKDRGLSLVAEGRLNISPAYEILGNVISAGFNLPLDRVVVELNSISESLDNRNTAYQRIALLLGWRQWDVNAKNEENEFIRLVYKELRAIENRKKQSKPKKPKKPKKPSK